MTLGLICDIVINCVTIIGIIIAVVVYRKSGRIESKYLDSNEIKELKKKGWFGNLSIVKKILIVVAVGLVMFFVYTFLMWFFLMAIAADPQQQFGYFEFLEGLFSSWF
jgi:hypothetical protein